MYHLSKQFGGSILLAGPGAAISAFLFAGFVFLVLPYSWPWTFCVLLGAILCATDPIAILQVLHNSGASQHFSVLLASESLLNDGVALVLFTLYYENVYSDRVLNAEYTSIYFVKVLIISPILGIAFGFGAVLLLSFPNRLSDGRDTIIQIAIALSW